MNETSAGQTTCAAFWVKSIAETLDAAGLDTDALFEEAGLELTALSDVDARFPTEGISRLWQLAVARSSNPAIGLASSSVVKPGSFDVVAYAMMSSPNLLGMLERTVRYVDILSDAATAPSTCRIGSAEFASATMESKLIANRHCRFRSRSRIFGSWRLYARRQ